MFKEFNIKFENVNMIGGTDNLLEGTGVTKVVMGGDNNTLSSLNSMMKNCSELDTIEGSIDLNGVKDMDNLLTGTPLINNVGFKNINNNNMTITNAFDDVATVNIDGVCTKTAMQNFFKQLGWDYDKHIYTGTMINKTPLLTSEFKGYENIQINNTVERASREFELQGQTYQNSVSGQSEKVLVDPFDHKTDGNLNNEYNMTAVQKLDLKEVQGNTLKNIIDGKKEMTLVNPFDFSTNGGTAYEYTRATSVPMDLKEVKGNTLKNLITGGKGEHDLVKEISVDLKHETVSADGTTVGTCLPIGTKRQISLALDGEFEADITRLELYVNRIGSEVGKKLQYPYDIVNGQYVHSLENGTFTTTITTPIPLIGVTTSNYTRRNVCNALVWSETDNCYWIEEKVVSRKLYIDEQFAKIGVFADKTTGETIHAYRFSRNSDLYVTQENPFFYNICDDLKTNAYYYSQHNDVNTVEVGSSGGSPSMARPMNICLPAEYDTEDKAKAYLKTLDFVYQINPNHVQAANYTTSIAQVKRTKIPELNKKFTIRVKNGNNIFTSKGWNVCAIKLENKAKQFSVELSPNKNYYLMYHGQKTNGTTPISVKFNNQTSNITLDSTSMKKYKTTLTTGTTITDNNLYLSGEGNRVKDVMLMEVNTNDTVGFVDNVQSVGEYDKKTGKYNVEVKSWFQSDTNYVSKSIEVDGTMGFESFEVNEIKGNTHQDDTFYVNSVGREGKNLFRTTMESGDILSSSGDLVSSTSKVRTIDFIPVRPGIRYYMQRTISGGSVEFRHYNSRKEYINSSTGMSGATTGSWFIANGNYIKIIDSTNKMDNIYHIEIGDTKFGYESPYNGYKLQLICKNSDHMMIPFYDYGQIDYTTGNVITPSSHSTKYSEFVEVKPNTYYSHANAGRSAVAVYDSNKTFIESYVGNPPSFTTGANAKYLRFYMMSVQYGHENGLNIVSDTIAYEDNRDEIILPYKLHKIGNVCDRLYWDNIKGHYCIERNIGHYRFTGNESLIDLNTNGSWQKPNTYRWRTNGKLLPNFNTDNTSQSVIYCMSNIAKPVTYSDLLATDVEGVACSNAYNNEVVVLSVAKSKVATTIKDYLATNPIDIYYVQAKEIIDLPQYSRKLKVNAYKDRSRVYVLGVGASDMNIDMLKSRRHSFMLNEPLRKIGNYADRLYWDKKKGHYCVERNIYHLYIKDTLPTIQGCTYHTQWGSGNNDYSLLYYDFNINGLKNNQEKPTLCIINANPKWNLIDGYLQQEKVNLKPYIFIHGALKFTVPKGDFPYDYNMANFVEYTKNNPIDLYTWQIGGQGRVEDLPQYNKYLNFETTIGSNYVTVHAGGVNSSSINIGTTPLRFENNNIMPDTDYTLKLLVDKNNSTNNITVNLGGTSKTLTPTNGYSEFSTTIKAPPALTNSYLELIGEGNLVKEIMLFKGTRADNTKYLNGVQSVGELQSDGKYKVDIISNTGTLIPYIIDGYRLNSGKIQLYGNNSLLIYKVKKGITYYLNAPDGISLFPANSSAYWIESIENFTNVIGIDAIIGSQSFANQVVFDKEGYIVFSKLGSPSEVKALSEKIYFGTDISYKGVVTNNALTTTTQSFILNEPLRKVDNVYDRLYWDKNREHYCIERNIKSSQIDFSTKNFTQNSTIGHGTNSTKFTCQLIGWSEFSKTAVSYQEPICDKFLCMSDYNLHWYDKSEYIGKFSLTFSEAMVSLKTRVALNSMTTTTEFDTYIKSFGTVNIMYKLSSPIIEDLPQYNQYMDFDTVLGKNQVVIVNSHVSPTQIHIGTTPLEYETGLLPNTVYTVQADINKNSSTSNLTLNVGGTNKTLSVSDGKLVTQITTPSTLTSNSLKLTGVGLKTKEVMLLKEDRIEDLSYFDGIQSFGEYDETSRKYKVQFVTESSGTSTYPTNLEINKLLLVGDAHNIVRVYTGITKYLYYEFDFKLGGDYLKSGTIFCTNQGAKTINFNKDTSSIYYEGELIAKISLNTKYRLTMAKEDEVIKVFINGELKLTSTKPLSLNTTQVAFNTHFLTGYAGGVDGLYVYNYKYQESNTTPKPPNEWCTPFREYTLLLDEPLRRIGSASDRLYYDVEKQHYCVEKKIIQEVINTANYTGVFVTVSGTWGAMVSMNLKADMPRKRPLLDKIICVGNEDLHGLGTTKYTSNFGGITDDGYLRIFVKLIFNEADALKNINNSNINIVYESTTPQIIDLPQYSKDTIGRLELYQEIPTKIKYSSELKPSKTKIEYIDII